MSPLFVPSIRNKLSFILALVIASLAVSVWLPYQAGQKNIRAASEISHVHYPYLSFLEKSLVVIDRAQKVQTDAIDFADLDLLDGLNSIVFEFEALTEQAIVDFPERGLVVNDLKTKFGAYLIQAKYVVFLLVEVGGSNVTFFDENVEIVNEVKKKNLMWKELQTTYEQLRASETEVLSIKLADIEVKTKSDQKTSFAITLLLSLTISFVMILIIRQSTNRLKSAIDFSIALRSGRLDAELPKDFSIKTKDEISSLMVSLDKMRESLFEHNKNLESRALFLNALNFLRAEDSYREVVRLLRAEYNLAAVALFIGSDKEDLEIAAFDSLDENPLMESGLHELGVVRKVFETGRFEHLFGPFTGRELNVSFGLGEKIISEISVWPIEFKRERVGVVLMLHYSFFDEGDRKSIEETFNHLGIRIYSYQQEMGQNNLIQELKDQSKELAVASERAESANKLKSQFLTTMSHELKTPLNSVIGFSNRVQAGLKKNNPELNREISGLDRIRASGEHLLGLIEDILDISTIESGSTDLNISQFRVASIFLLLEQSLKIKARHKGLDLEFIMDDDSIEMNADKSKLTQIISNLVNNSIKFSESGKVSVKVCETDNDQMDCVNFIVEDGGVGIAKEDQTRIFHAFEQLDNTMSRSGEGSGLGLAITKSLVELHHGQMSLASEVGKGTIFNVMIPKNPQTRSVIRH